MIAALISFEDKQDFKLFWAGHNANHHLLVREKILATQNISLTLFCLDPIPDTNEGLQRWLNSHAQMHSDVNFVLGLQDQNISTVDFTDPGQRLEWLQAHFEDHRQWGQILGVDS
jgi:hypothetical protein